MEQDLINDFVSKQEEIAENVHQKCVKDWTYKITDDETFAIAYLSRQVEFKYVWNGLKLTITTSHKCSVVWDGKKFIIGVLTGSFCR